MLSTLKLVKSKLKSFYIKFEFEEKKELELQTRATLPANILDQLNGIPVNIKLVGEPSYPYLSAQTSGIIINLYSKDDGSKRQRWNIKKLQGLVFLRMLMEFLLQEELNMIIQIFFQMVFYLIKLLHVLLQWEEEELRF
ncbi:MAG: hypothetical protein LIO97_11045 [Tannerellaceae bacterium]|nr:hypothetical protein [Tannerellaceae bacterium]